MKVRYTLRARSDLDAFYRYLDVRNSSVAQSVKNLIERHIARLGEFPFMAPATDEPGIYELTIVRYSYKVYYEVAANEVWVIHIRNTRRQPWEAER